MAFIIKRNDLRPRYRAQLTQTDPTNPAQQIPVNLTDATAVRFLMTEGTGGTPKVDAAADFVDRVSGIVEYTWAAGDTDTVGDYNVEFEVMWGTEPQTFPSDGYFTAKITQDLA